MSETSVQVPVRYVIGAGQLSMLTVLIGNALAQLVEHERGGTFADVGWQVKTEELLHSFRLVTNPDLQLVKEPILEADHASARAALALMHGAVERMATALEDGQEKAYAIARLSLNRGVSDLGAIVIRLLAPFQPQEEPPAPTRVTELKPAC
jgi:hypothetical protein